MSKVMRAIDAKSFIIGVLSAVVVCVGGLAIAEENPAQLIPLQVGNTWVYSQSKSDKSGGILQLEDAYARVVEEKKVGDKTWYKYLEFGDNYWVRNDTGGQYEADCFFTGTSPDKDTEEYLFLRYPVQDTPIKYEVPSGDVMNVVSESVAVKTEAGEFRCYHYRIVDSEVESEVEFTVDLFISPGKGLVRNCMEDEESITVYELKKIWLMDK